MRYLLWDSYTLQVQSITDPTKLTKQFFSVLGTTRGKINGGSIVILEWKDQESNNGIYFNPSKKLNTSKQNLFTIAKLQTSLLGYPILLCALHCTNFEYIILIRCKALSVPLVLPNFPQLRGPWILVRLPTVHCCTPDRLFRLVYKSIAISQLEKPPEDYFTGSTLDGSSMTLYNIGHPRLFTYKLAMFSIPLHTFQRCTSRKQTLLQQLRHNISEPYSPSH